jgi:hypothetical protein
LLAGGGAVCAGKHSGNGVFARPRPCACLCRCVSALRGLRVPRPQTAALPALPRHAAYVRHQNVCYDWGSYGWLLLQTALVNIGQYRYFFFVNSSVRGPFLPAYARVSERGQRFLVLCVSCAWQLWCVGVPMNTRTRAVAHTDTLAHQHTNTPCSVTPARLSAAAGHLQLDERFHVPPERRREAGGQHHQLRGKPAARQAAGSLAPEPARAVVRARNRRGARPPVCVCACVCVCVRVCVRVCVCVCARQAARVAPPVARPATYCTHVPAPPSSHTPLRTHRCHLSGRPGHPAVCAHGVCVPARPLGHDLLRRAGCECSRAGGGLQPGLPAAALPGRRLA